MIKSKVESHFATIPIQQSLNFIPVLTISTVSLYYTASLYFDNETKTILRLISLGGLNFKICIHNYSAICKKYATEVLIHIYLFDIYSYFVCSLIYL